jgi:transcriptional regulator with XRE-family HTH domain
MKTSFSAQRRDIVRIEGPEKPRAYTGMPANTLTASAAPTASLGEFLRNRRARLAPDAAAAGRRRTPGLRREEVAARAAVSVTWYTWLEQGRGGPPSEEVLERLSGALQLDDASREMMFLLARQRPPPVRAAATAQVCEAVQRVLDAMPTSPAMVKTPTWDIVAWNDAAAALMGVDPAMAPRERNSLRRIFSDPVMRTVMPDWEEHARSMLAVFRMDVARIGGSPEADALVAELRAASADFRRLWAENEVRSHGAGMKRLNNPFVGPFTLEISAFAVDGAEGLTMLVFTPASAADARAIEALMARRAEAA